MFHYSGNRDEIIDEIKGFDASDVEGYLRFAEATEPELTPGAGIPGVLS